MDVLEHINPADRPRALAEFARVAHSHIILNYPCAESKEAQVLAFKLTGNALIKEHVDWDLPDSDWVLAELKKYGFDGGVHAHASVAVWIGQFVLFNQLPEAAADLNRYLIQNHCEEPGSKPLYHLLVCRKDQCR